MAIIPKIILFTLLGLIVVDTGCTLYPLYSSAAPSLVVPYQIHLVWPVSYSSNISGWQMSVIQQWAGFYSTTEGHTTGTGSLVRCIKVDPSHGDQYCMVPRLLAGYIPTQTNNKSKFFPLRYSSSRAPHYCRQITTFFIVFYYVTSCHAPIFSRFYFES